jgi:DNA-binding NarL/FixJ family response regulator
MFRRRIRNECSLKITHFGDAPRRRFGLIVARVRGGPVVQRQENYRVRIIIADDQKHARSGLKALLSASLPGSQFWEAATGLEAERLAAEVRPQLILMDIRMPELDGLSATRRIKSRQPEIKILVLSLHEGCAEEAMNAGADAFVSKGESPEQLLGAVTALVSGPGAGSSKC